MASEPDWQTLDAAVRRFPHLLQLLRALPPQWIIEWRLVEAIVAEYHMILGDDRKALAELRQQDSAIGIVSRV